MYYKYLPLSTEMCEFSAFSQKNFLRRAGAVHIVPYSVILTEQSERTKELLERSDLEFLLQSKVLRTDSSTFRIDIARWGHDPTLQYPLHPCRTHCHCEGACVCGDPFPVINCKLFLRRGFPDILPESLRQFFAFAQRRCCPEKRILLSCCPNRYR